MTDKSKCCTCGFEWVTGRDGSHSCTSKLLDKLADYKAALIETQRLLKNGADGAIVDTVWSDTAGETTLYELIEITINDD